MSKTRPIGTQPKLPKPRKEPKQQRSQATVGYIVDAARQILHEEGADAVTTRRVSERSGVAVGSLYQYFPNRDAILARLVEEEVRSTSRSIQEYYASVRKLPLAELLSCSIERLVQNERRMMALGGDFYRRYAQYYQVAHRTSRERSADVLDAGTLTFDTHRLLQHYKDEIGDTDMVLAAYLLARGISAMLSSLLTEHSELLDSPHLSEMLSRMAIAVVTNPSSGRDR